MVKTIEKGFQEFLGTLLPPPEESQAAKKRRLAIEACLQKHFETTRFFPSGSFGNGTSIPGYSDADYFACIPPKNLKQNSFTTLQEVQDVLIKRFPNADIRVRPPAVKVCFGSDASASIEIVPADFIERDKDGNCIYEIANDHGDGSWMRSSPDAHNNYVDEVDNEFGGNGDVKRLVRLLKAWKYYCGVPIKSFYLELFVTRHVESKNSIVFSKDITSILTRLWNEKLAPLKDPTGISARIQPCSPKEHPQALRQLQIALERAEEARDAEKRDDIRSAFSSWNKVYNRKFPPYD